MGFLRLGFLMVFFYIQFFYLIFWASLFGWVFDDLNFIAAFFIPRFYSGF